MSQSANLISSLEETGLWKNVTETLYSHKDDGIFYFHSDMKGYTSGRYRIEIKHLKKRRLGKRYRCKLFWTPYNPDCLVEDFRVDNFEEFSIVVSGINTDLLDQNRKFSLQ